jgi:anti-sigma B factor antagonist
VTLGDVQTSLHDSAVVARLTGEIDMSNAAGIEEAIALGTPNHVMTVIVDLSELDYLDSAGIQLLYQLREQLQVRGQSLRLVIAADSPAADALRLAGVMDELDVSPTLQEALGPSGGSPESAS